MTFQKDMLETLIVTEHKCNYMVLPVRTNTRPHCSAAPAAGDAEQSQPRRVGLHKQLQSSYCHPGFPSTANDSVQVCWYSRDISVLTAELGFIIVGCLFLPWVIPMCLLLHIQAVPVHMLWHTKAQQCLSSLLGMRKDFFKDRQGDKAQAQFSPPSTSLIRSHHCALCNIQFGLGLNVNPSTTYLLPRDTMQQQVKQYEDTGHLRYIFYISTHMGLLSKY